MWCFMKECCKIMKFHIMKKVPEDDNGFHSLFIHEMIPVSPYPFCRSLSIAHMPLTGTLNLAYFAYLFRFSQLSHPFFPINTPILQDVLAWDLLKSTE